MERRTQMLSVVRQVHPSLARAASFYSRAASSSSFARRYPPSCGAATNRRNCCKSGASLHRARHHTRTIGGVRPFNSSTIAATSDSRTLAAVGSSPHADDAPSSDTDTNTTSNGVTSRFGSGSGGSSSSCNISDTLDHANREAGARQFGEPGAETSALETPRGMDAEQGGTDEPSDSARWLARARQAIDQTDDVVRDKAERDSDGGGGGDEGSEGGSSEADASSWDQEEREDSVVSFGDDRVIVPSQSNEEGGQERDDLPTLVGFDGDEDTVRVHDGFSNGEEEDEKGDADRADVGSAAAAAAAVAPIDGGHEREGATARSKSPLEMRLSRRIARSGMASRREAER